MLDRREFVTKGAAAGVALAGGSSLLHVPAALAATPKGLAVGDKVPKISGLDQYDGKGTLSHLKGSWVLLDICATWCPPCNDAASEYASLTREVNAAGVPFSVFSVLREGPSTGTPATRSDAERWSNRYGYQRDWVLHTDSTESTLWKIFEEICAANSVELAYPTHLLIDPTGVARYFQQEDNTTKIQAEIAKLTGATLPGNYEERGPVPPGLGPDVGAVTFSFGLQGGGTVSETLALGAESSVCSWSLQEGVPEQTRVFLKLKGGRSVDMSVPISVVLHPGQLRSYWEAGALPEGYFPVALYSGSPEEANLIALGGLSDIVNLEDGSGSGVSNVDPGQSEQGPAWGSPASVIELELPMQTIAVYGATLGLKEHLAGNHAEKTAEKLLGKALKDLSHRDFAAAQTALSEAATDLGSGSELARSVAWLLSH